MRNAIARLFDLETSKGTMPLLCRIGDKRKGRFLPKQEPPRCLHVPCGARLHSVVHRRYSVKQIGNQAIVSNLEDRCFVVLVNRDDDFAVLHARQVLNSA